MESGWLVNSNLSNSEVSAASLPGRSYQISPTALPSWRELIHGCRSTIPQGFETACARACSIAKALTPSCRHDVFRRRSAAAKCLEPLGPTAHKISVDVLLPSVLRKRALIDRSESVQN